MSEPLKAVDLFAGGGGLSLGFQNAGVKVLAAFDHWHPAVEIYRANLKDHPIFEADLADQNVWSQIQSYQPDMIIGGPPCQDFSSAGKRDETGGRANLTVVFAEIIRQIRPRYFVMENVERARKSKAFFDAKSIFQQSGYALSAMVLDASLCGVPQTRKRFFVFGSLDGRPNELIPHIVQRQASKPMTLRDYFGDSLGFEHYYRHPRSYQRRGVFSIDEPSPTIRGVNRPVPQGYPGHPGDTAPVTETLRPLTTRERSLVQTFPSDYVLAGTKTDLEQIIGNAVPVKLAEFVATALQSMLIDRDRTETVYPACSAPEQLVLFEQKAVYPAEEKKLALLPA